MPGSLTLSSWPTTTGFSGASYFDNFLEQFQFGMPSIPGVLPSRTEDILGSYTDELKVVGDSTGMQVKVSGGRAIAKGIFAKIPDASLSGGVYTLTVTAAHATLQRVDRVIIRYDLTTGSATLRMLDGTAAATGSAVPAALTQSATTWDVPLALVIVDPTVTTIAPVDVIDKRVFSYSQDSLMRALALDDPIVNGSFNIWDDGATFSSIASGTYGPNKWYYQKSGTAVHDLLRSTDVPAVAEGVPLLNYSLHLDVTTADASIASGEYSTLIQLVQGYTFLPFAQRAFTLPFWVKDSVIGPHAVAFINSGVDRSFVGQYFIEAADTWELHWIHVSPSPSAGTWNYTDGNGLQIWFPQAVGSGFHTAAPGSWVSANLFGTSRTVNSLSSTANNFKLAGVGRLCRGGLVLPPPQRPYAVERELVTQRIVGSINMNGTIAWSRGVSSITDNGAGDATVTALRAFANANFGAGATPQADPGGSAATSLMAHALVTSKTATTQRFAVVRASDGGLTDPTRLNFWMEGAAS